MRLLSLTLIIMTLLFSGCGGGSSESESAVTRSNAPQPSGVDEAVRPPKPPSI